MLFALLDGVANLFLSWEQQDGKLLVYYPEIPDVQVFFGLAAAHPKQLLENVLDCLPDHLRYICLVVQLLLVLKRRPQNIALAHLKNRVLQLVNFDDFSMLQEVRAVPAFCAFAAAYFALFLNPPCKLGLAKDEAGIGLVDSQVVLVGEHAQDPVGITKGFIGTFYHYNNY